MWKNRLGIVFLVVFFGVVSVSKIWAEGGGVGDGGSFVKEGFFQAGFAVSGQLQTFTSRERLSIFGNEKFELPFLNLVLQERNVEVRKGPLFDKFGSKVAAKVEGVSPVHPGLLKIVLDEDIWTKHFQPSAGSIYIMVCHEMMRSMQINDDEFRYCESITRRLTSPSFRNADPMTMGERAFEIFGSPRNSLDGLPSPCILKPDPIWPGVFYLKSFGEQIKATLSGIESYRMDSNYSGNVLHQTIQIRARNTAVLGNVTLEVSFRYRYQETKIVWVRFIETSDATGTKKSIECGPRPESLN